MSQRTVECHLVGLLDPSACRKPLGDPGHRHTGRRDHLGKIVCCGLALHIGTQRENHFLRSFLTQTLEEFRDAKMLRSDAVKRREFSSQGMVSPPEHTGSLQRKDIGRGLHDAKFPTLTRSVMADGAHFLFGKESAKTACAQSPTGPGNGSAQLLGFGIGGAEHPECYPFGAPGTDPG
jgi:hypothetical protein